jgi:uncharacterized lipoprotein YmbA
MKKIHVVLAFVMATIMAAVLVGCSTPELEDGYQLGDVTHIVIREEEKIKQAKQTYCDSVTDSIARAAALRLIRLKYPFIPENGICG